MKVPPALTTGCATISVTPTKFVKADCIDGTVGPSDPKFHNKSVVSCVLGNDKSMPSTTVGLRIDGKWNLILKDPDTCESAVTIIVCTSATDGETDKVLSKIGNRVK